MPFVARFILALIVPACCGSLCNLSESDAKGLVQIHAQRLVDDPYSRQYDRLHRRHRRQHRRQDRRYGRRTTTTTSTLLPDVINLLKALETSREALEATFSALADSLTGRDARLVRDLSDKWFSMSGSTSLATDFVINYAANDTYNNNKAGLVDALNTIVASLSGSVSLLQSRASAVSDNLADSCSYLASYAVPVFGEGNLYEMLTELQAVCGDPNVAAALPAAAEPNAAALIEGVEDLVAVSTSLGSPCTLDPGVNWAADLVAVSTSLGSPCTLDPGVNWAAAPMWREGTCFPYGGAPGNTACSATSTFNKGRLDLLKRLSR
ncbi:unnamed protein product [Durusdinium trenchii]|uniref:Uncharacterized protein n=1 Tax=Durusdinium trenchii TaxID=1381693 RepID=A0ABP0JX22_9DINO